jgi:glycosyltransferase involved in cell wall biosynthesis
VEWRELKFDRSQQRFRYGMKDDAVVVLFLARMVASKRPQDVVRAVARVHKNTGDEIQFVFAGQGPEREKCEALAAELGVDNIVSFLGAVPHAEVPAVMSASDVFVTTSDITNMAIPTCEALICGVPVVAYDVGDTQKVVIDGDTGVLVEDGNFNRLADALASLVNDPKKRRRLAQSARKFSRDNFTGWDDRIGMEMGILERLIAGGSGATVTAR